jgi:toxin ParE1/3/4
MGHRLAPQAQADIDEIAYYVFLESGSLETADRLIESITTRFNLLGTHPRAGRRRDDLRPGMRGFPVGEYVILYRIDGSDALILHVLHGGRDIQALLRSDPPVEG